MEEKRCRRKIVIFERMARLPLDTLRLAKRLEEAGFPPAQAEAQIQVLIELLTMQEAATKTDIQKLRLRTKRDLRLTESQLRKEIQAMEARLRAEIEKFQLQMKEMETRLRAEIRRSYNRIIFWVAALIAAQIPIFYLLKRLLP
jgi:uncharacterized protein YlxW (UPF0749 family)